MSRVLSLALSEGTTTAAGFSALQAAVQGAFAVEGAALMARARAFDEILGDTVGTFEPMLACAPGRLAALLRRRGLRDPDGLAGAVAAVHAGLTPAASGSLDAVLARALVPQSALVTVPVQALFEESEAAALVDAAKEVTNVPNARPIDLRQRGGEPIDYSGYLCVILKATRLCNLRCTYCHDWSEDKRSTVGFPLMLRLVQQALCGDRAAVDFVLHGGEPLMAGRPWLLRLLAMQAHLARPNQVVRTHLQTNGTLLDARWLALLELFGLRASVSLDGPMMLHDAVRRDVLGRATWRRTRDAISAIEARGLLSGVLLVVGRATLELGPHRLLDFLRDEGLDSVCLLAERPLAGAPGSVSRREYVAFLAAVAAARASRGGHAIQIREIDSVAKLLDGEGSGFCELAGSCVGTFISVDGAGDVSHCDKYVGDPAYIGGNLWQESLDAILKGPRFAAMAAKATEGILSEAGCAYSRLCRGWCPHERYVAASEGGCCGLSPLFDVLSRARAAAHG
jgi:uncharacterized protein